VVGVFLLLGGVGEGRVDGERVGSSEGVVDFSEGLGVGDDVALVLGVWVISEGGRSGRRERFKRGEEGGREVSLSSRQGERRKEGSC